MSSGFMFNDIIISMIKNEAVECQSEGVDSYFTNIKNNTIYMYRGSLQDILWKKGTHESP